LLQFNSAFTQLQPAHQSRGSLSFQINKQLFEAESAHARAYAVMNTSVGYLSAANQENMILNVEAEGLVKPGSLTLTKAGAGSCTLTLKHVEFGLNETDDYLRITVTNSKTENQMILLSGSFEGRLHDKKGNEIVIRDGRFKTDHL